VVFGLVAGAGRFFTFCGWERESERSAASTKWAGYQPSIQVPTSRNAGWRTRGRTKRRSPYGAATLC
jgi:hypothetical protein